MVRIWCKEQQRFLKPGKRNHKRKDNTVKKNDGDGSILRDPKEILKKKETFLRDIVGLNACSQIPKSFNTF